MTQPEDDAAPGPESHHTAPTAELDNSDELPHHSGGSYDLEPTSTTTTTTLHHRRSNLKRGDSAKLSVRSNLSMHAQRDLDRIREDAKEARVIPVPPLGTQLPWYQDVWKGCRRAVNYQKSKSPREWMETLLPCSRWLPAYEWKSTLMRDVVAGLTVGVMVVPQGMSYAKLAGLPVQFGLYSAFVPLYFYALFGSSRQLAIGPVAIVSLLLSSGLIDVMNRKGISTDNDDYQAIYNRMAVQISFMVGVAFMVMGVARLGFITTFLSHAVISGFTSGAAIVIALSQVKYIFGYDIPRVDTVHETLKDLFDNISKFNYKTFLMGMGAIAVLVAFKRIGTRYPTFKVLRTIGPLTVTVLGIVLVAIFQLNLKGIPIVKSIPHGLPPFTADEWFPVEDFPAMIPVILTVGLVGFMESVAIAKKLASKNKYQINASTELIGLGVANFFGGMFSAYPVVGSFSRSAVNNDAGAQSGISGIVTATLVGLVLLLLTPVFELLPYCILAAIIIAGVISLVDYPEAINLWKVHKLDFVVWVAAFLGTMFAGSEIGLAISVGLSLLIFVFEAAFSSAVVLGRLPGTWIYRDRRQYPEGEQYNGCLLLRIEGPLYFLNAQTVRDKLQSVVASKEAGTFGDDDPTDVRYLILDFSAVSRIDASSLHILDELIEDCDLIGRQMCLVNPNCLVMERMEASGFAKHLGRERIFSSAHAAVLYCLAEMEAEADQEELAGVAQDLALEGTNGEGVHRRHAPSFSEIDV